jgi:hypothetical protein
MGNGFRDSGSCGRHVKDGDRGQDLEMEGQGAKCSGIDSSSLPLILRQLNMLETRITVR